MHSSPETLVGIVRDARTHQAIEHVRVEAWSRHKGASLLVGSSATDAKGAFAIRLRGEADAVTFVVHRAGEVIADTEATPTPVPCSGREIVIEVDDAPLSELYLRGRVVDVDVDVPIPGLRVEVWQVGRRRHHHVTSVVTGRDGKFYAQLDDLLDPSKHDATPRVFFRVFRNLELVLTTERHPCGIDEREFELRVAFPSDCEPEPPTLTEAQRAALAERADQTFSRVAKELPELGAALTRVAEHDLQIAVRRRFADASAELRYFVADLDAPPTGVSVVDAIRAALPASALSEAARADANTRLAAWSGPTTVEETLRVHETLATNPVVSEVLEGDRRDALASVGGVDRAKVEAVARRLPLDELSPQRMKTLVDAGVIDAPAARAIGASSDFLRLAKGSAPLAAALANRTNARLSDLASLSPDDWREVVAAASPHATPDAIAARARELDLTVQARFPSDAFRTRLRRDRPDDTNQLDALYPGLGLAQLANDPDEQQRRIALVDRFHTQNDGARYLEKSFVDAAEVERFDWSGFSEDDRRRTLDLLKADRRIARVAQNVEEARTILAAGYHHATGIVNSGFDDFRARTGFADEDAGRLFRNARRITNEAVGRFGILADYQLGGLEKMLGDNVSLELRSFVQSLEGISELFGSTGYCKCRHCQSIMSPAAYFVDLMVFLETHALGVFGAWPSEHVLHPRNRRPDLWESLPLTCASTDERLPYLAIVLEVLEAHMVRIPEIAGVKVEIEDQHAA